MSRFLLHTRDGRNLPEVIPPTTVLGGYVPGSEFPGGGWGQIVHAHPDNRVLQITDTLRPADVLDLTPNLVLPGRVPAWLLMARRDGFAAWVLCRPAQIKTLRRVCTEQSVQQPLWWCSRVTPSAEIPTGAIGVVYADNGLWCASQIIDYIPGFDGWPDRASS